MRAGPLNLADLDKAYLVIVQHFAQPRGVIHQVVLRPDKIHDGLIRLGETQGIDELAGWQRPENLQIISVLGTVHEVVDGKWVCRPILEKAEILEKAALAVQDPWRGGQCA